MKEEVMEVSLGEGLEVHNVNLINHEKNCDMRFKALVIMWVILIYIVVMF